MADAKVYEKAAYVSKRAGRSDVPVEAGCQFSIASGFPPPHDRMHFRLAGRESLDTVEATLAWQPPKGWTGPSADRRAMALIGQGIAANMQRDLPDEEVAAIVAGWLAWARKKPGEGK